MRQVICSLGLHREFTRGSQTYSGSQNFITFLSVYKLNKSLKKNVFIRIFIKPILNMHKILKW